jgi:hypothetical protein
MTDFKITAQDFDQLRSNGTNWGQWAKDQEGRFDVMGAPYGTVPNYDFKHAYWMDDSWSNVLLGKMFLAQEGFTYQVLWDNADNTSEIYLTDLVNLARQVATSEEGARALCQLIERLRTENTSYVLLTDYSSR